MYRNVSNAHGDYYQRRGSVTYGRNNELFTEVLPALWIGGTHDDDIIDTPVPFGETTSITGEHFDYVVTLYGSARPVDWFVEEIRFGIRDGDMSDFDTDDILDMAKSAHKAWRKGKRVLIRCRAGHNRSGMVMALVLMRDGLSARDSIALVKERRTANALRNYFFTDWLLSFDNNKKLMRKLRS